ncbi:hypothetical protein SDC9_77879 [bioreactor metagenome]|uniref:Uncharacterized protein n=1 Tax=bioreactor metagenome TaxID=1076179 RepID=A0A644YZE3_9ZZZZ
MQDHGSPGYIVNRKDARVAPVGKNGFQIVYLLYIKLFANIFHQPDIPEEIGAERSIARDDIFNNVQS